MAGRRRKAAPFPGTSQILAYLRDNPDAGRRDVARAFRLDARQRSDLKTLLDRLEDEGARPRRRRGRRGGAALPSVTVIEITGTDTDGEVLARPVSWDDDTPPPPIVMTQEKKPRAALGPGDSVLARLRQGADGNWEARTMRRIPSAPDLVLGLYAVVDGKGRVRPTDRRAKHDFAVDTADALDARPGDLVRARVLPGRRLGLRQARIVERLHDAEGPGSISLIAIHEHGLPGEFDADALAEAAAAGPTGLDGRDDLRDLPWLPSTAPMPVTSTTPYGRNRTPTAAGTSSSPSPTSPTTCPQAAASTPPPTNGETPPIFRTGWCRCCRKRSPTAGAPCGPAKTVPVSPPTSGWTEKGSYAAIVSDAALCGRRRA